MRNLLFALPLLVLHSAMSGCALYREPAGAPALALDNKWTNGGENIAAGDNIVHDWWKRFDDPVLDALVDRALTGNTDVREALANVETARALYGFERRQYLPSGGPALSVEKRRYSEIEAGVAGKQEIHRGGLAASWEPDLFGRIRNGNRVARARLMSAAEAVSATRLLVVAEVAATYHHARAAEERSDVRQRALEDQRNVVELIRVRVQEHRVAADVLDQALAELSVDEADLLREREQLKVLEHRMAVLLGLQAGQWRLPAAADGATLRLQPVAVGDVGMLLRNRPDIRMAEQALIARQAGVNLARADYFPRLTLAGFFGFAAGRGGDLGDDGTESWFLGPTLSWNALDLGRTGNRVEAARSGADAASVVYERTVLRAIEEAENSFLRYATAQRELGLSEIRRRHAKAASDAAQARYEEGLGDYLAALIARRDALTAEIGRVNGLAGHRLATVDVFTSLGVGP